MPPLLAIEIGGTKLQIVTGDGTGIIQERHRFSVSKAQGAGGIRRQIETTLQGICGKIKPAAMGVGFGGPVNRPTGRIACSHQIEGWSDFPLAEWLHSLTSAPVFVDNDANVAALGEAVHGAGQGFNPVFYVTLGSGVGGGLVVNGALFHGAIPGESEIGHLRLDKSGTLLESRCSGWAVDRKIQEAIKTHSDGVLAHLCGNKNEGGEAKFLKAALEKKDPVAERILTETAEDLAFGLSHVVHLQHPQIVVLGGGLSLVGEPLRGAVEQMMPRFLMEVFLPGPNVVLAALGEDAVPVGALELARQGLAL